MIAVVLAALAAVVVMSALRWLPGAGWVYRAPRLGIAAWYAVLATAVVAVGSAVAEALLPFPGGGAACTAVIWCTGAIGDDHGPLAWIAARLLAAATAAVAGLAAVRGLRSIRTIARSRRRHRDMVRLAGRRSTALNALVIEHPDPAAYVLSGRSCGVVVTSGALHRLGQAELAAVLAHERAHVTGHHQTLLDVVRVAAVVLPRARLVATAGDQIGRLVEMRADEVAAQRHPRLDLARALVAMTAGRDTAATPGGLAAATGGDTVERLHRLMRPPRRLPRPVSAALTTAVAALPVVPLGLAAACRWWPFLAACLWGF